MKILKEIERLMQPGGEQEAAPRRQAADKEFKYRRVGVAMIQISLDHVDLIKVGQQRTGCGFHDGDFRRAAAILNAYGTKVAFCRDCCEACQTLSELGRNLTAARQFQFARRNARVKHNSRKDT